MFYDISFFCIQGLCNKFCLCESLSFNLRFLRKRRLERCKKKQRHKEIVLTLLASDCLRRLTVAEVFITVCIRWLVLFLSSIILEPESAMLCCKGGCWTREADFAFRAVFTWISGLKEDLCFACAAAVVLSSRVRAALLRVSLNYRCCMMVGYLLSPSLLVNSFGFACLFDGLFSFFVWSFEIRSKDILFDYGQKRPEWVR